MSGGRDGYGRGVRGSKLGMSTRLTVIVPMYNSASTAEEAIASVRAQSFRDWTMIVVNDGSTDEGPRIVTEIAKVDPRIRMITQGNRGLAGARNTGLEAALREGDASTDRYVHFLDADDWMTPRAYEWLVAGAKETGASYGGYALRGPKGEMLGRESPMSAPMVGLNEQVEWNRAATHALLFRADLLREERFDEALPCVEDYDLWLRLAMRGVRWKGVERIVCDYRLRPDSMSKKFAVMAATYEMVLRRAAVAARAGGGGGWEGRGVDLSEQRLTRVLGGMNLCYATMDALMDPMPNKARAAALLDSRTHVGREGGQFTAAQAAQAASTALLFGACTAPEIDGWSERRWLTPLRQWWVRCAEEGWMGFEDVAGALVELSRKVVHPDAIVAAMLENAERLGHAGEQGVVVLGADRFGRRVARGAAARGWRVLVLAGSAQGVDRRERECLEAVPGVRVVEDGGEGARQAVGDGFAGAPWLTGLAGGEATIQDAASDAGVRAMMTITWNEQRERIGAENLRRMRSALAMPRAMAG